MVHSRALDRQNQQQQWNKVNHLTCADTFFNEKLADYGCSELVKLYRENKLDIAAIVEQSQ